MKITLIRWICTQTRFSIRRLFFLTEAVSIVCGSALWFFCYSENVPNWWRVRELVRWPLIFWRESMILPVWFNYVKTVKRTQFGFYRRTLCKLMKNNKFAYRKLQISLGFSSRRRSDYRAKEVGSDGNKASHSPLQTALESFSVSAIKNFCKARHSLISILVRFDPSKRPLKCSP